MKLASFAIAVLSFFTTSSAIAIFLPTATPAQSSQSMATPDLALLGTALQRFFEHASYETTAEIRINSVAGNTSVQSSVSVRTIAQHPNRFRSEITFTNPDQPETKVTTLVVSNGQRVWLYRPDVKQYQVLTYDQFDQYDDSYWLGFSAMFYGQIPADVRQAIGQTAATGPQIMTELGVELKDLQGGLQMLENSPSYVYRYRNPQEGMTFSAFIEPTSAKLQQLQAEGRFEGADVTITERIRSRTPNPAIAPNTFTFSPPPGAKAVKTLRIGPL